MPIRHWYYHVVLCQEERGREMWGRREGKGGKCVSTSDDAKLGSYLQRGEDGCGCVTRGERGRGRTFGSAGFRPRGSYLLEDGVSQSHRRKLGACASGSSDPITTHTPPPSFIVSRRRSLDFARHTVSSLSPSPPSPPPPSMSLTRANTVVYTEVTPPPPQVESEHT